MHTPFLHMAGISKRFGGTQALRSVDFTAESGEVHAIVGENGAGKSTLSRILTGAVQCDAGEIRLGGEPQAIASPLRGQQLGIRMVAQHANLVPNLSITENVLLGGMPTGRFGWWIDWAAAHDRVRQILERIGFQGIDVRRRVARLSAAQRQIVEIAKAVAVKPRILIMDEPSAVLAQEDLTKLFALIRRLREENVLIFYISHRLDELYAIADRVTVLKDGALVGTVDPRRTQRDELIRLMVGRPLQDIFRRAPKFGRELLSLHGLGRAGSFKESRSLWPKARSWGCTAWWAAAAPRSRAASTVPTGRDGRDPRDGPRVASALAARCVARRDRHAYRGPDRRRPGSGAVDPRQREPCELPRHQPVGNARSPPAERTCAGEGARARRAPCRYRAVARKLSGGNQQKVVLAKWLTRAHPPARRADTWS